METNYYIESLKDYLKRAKNEIKDFMEYAELSEQFSYSLTVAQKIILNLEDYIDILKYSEKLEDIQILKSLKNILDYLKMYYLMDETISYKLRLIEININHYIGILNNEM